MFLGVGYHGYNNNKCHKRYKNRSHEKSEKKVVIYL